MIKKGYSYLAYYSKINKNIVVTSIDNNTFYYNEDINKRVILKRYDILLLKQL